MTEKVVYKPVQESGKEGNTPEFEVFTNAGLVEKWRKDKTVPLVDVVQSFDILEHPSGGASGESIRPSNATLSSYFGTHNETEVVQYILEHGKVQAGGKAGRINNGDRGAPSGQGTGAGR